jgi:hypothetical protein
VTVDVVNASGKTIRRLGSETLVRNMRATTSGYAPRIYAEWDGSAYNTATGHFEPVTEGSYKVQVKAMPATGNTAQTYEFPVKVDVTKPQVAMSNLLYAAENKLGFDLSASDENSGLWGHVVVVNDSVVKILAPNTTTTTIDLPKVPSGTDVEIAVVTFDNAGNAAVDSAVFTVVVPELLQVNTATYKVHPGAQLSFAVLNPAVTGVKWQLDGAGAFANATVNAGTATVTLPDTLSNGAHTLTLQAYEGAALMRTYTAALDSYNVAPVITIMSPQQKESYNSHDVRIEYSTDPGVTVLVNGETIPSGGFVTLPDGKQNVKFDLIDAYGNTATRSVSFYVDTTAPAVTLNGVPEDGIVTTQADTYTLTGTVADALHPYELRINGDIVYSENNMADEAQPYNFEWPVDMQSGTNLIKIEAEDALGNLFSKTVTVTRAPTLTVNSPVDDTWYSTSDVVIDVVTDASTIKVDGTTVANGSPVHFQDGTHTVKIDAVGPKGDITSKTVTFHVDTTGPAITLNGVPADGVVTTQDASYILAGTVADAMGRPYTLKINDAPAYDGAAPYEINWTVALNPGENLMTLEAKDDLGNTSTKTIKVVRTPSLTVTSPMQNQKFGAADVAFNFAADGATVKVNGTEVTSGATVHFEDGKHDVVVMATAGEFTTTRTVTIYVDTTAPVITANSTASTEAPTYTLTGTVTDAVLGFTVKVNDVVVKTANAAGSVSFSKTVDLVAGDNTFTITAEDEVGNISTKTVTVTRTAETLSVLTLNKSIFSPALSSSVKATVTVPVKTTLTVEVRDASGALVRTLSSGSKTAGTYSYTWNGKDAKNKIVADGEYTIVASTSAGGYLTATVTVDSTKPVVTITSPTAGAKVESKSLTITAEADASSAKVTLSGAATGTKNMVKGEDGSFSAEYSLTKDGTITATVEATDEAGNKQTTKVTFTADVAPTLTASGTASITSKTKTVKLSGSTSQKLRTPDGLTVKVNGEVDTTAKVTFTSTSWTATLTFAEDGEYTVSVTGTDTTGHESDAVTKSILIDTTAPVYVRHEVVGNKLQVYLTETGSGVKTGTVKVKFGSTTKTATFVKIDEDGSYVYQVDLPKSGTYKVYVTAADLAGNVQAYPPTASPNFELTIN